MSDLDHLEALAKAATPGPWRIRRGAAPLRPDVHFDVVSDHDGEHQVCETWLHGKTYREADAAIIVAAVNALPTLIARIRTLESPASFRAYIAAQGKSDLAALDPVEALAWHAAHEVLEQDRLAKEVDRLTAENADLRAKAANAKRVAMARPCGYPLVLGDLYGGKQLNAAKRKGGASNG